MSLYFHALSPTDNSIHIHTLCFIQPNLPQNLSKFFALWNTLYTVNMDVRYQTKRDAGGINACYEPYAYLHRTHWQYVSIFTICWKVPTCRYLCPWNCGVSPHGGLKASKGGHLRNICGESKVWGFIFGAGHCLDSSSITVMLLTGVRIMHL